MYNILVTIDSKYVAPLKVMLYSLQMSNPKGKFNIILIYSDIDDEEIRELKRYIESLNQCFTPILVDDSLFKDAPVTFYYTKVMYYRLLAYLILPSDIKKILYLDPDILIINPIDALYETDLSKYLFAACAHNGSLIGGINKVRLKNLNSERYFNSGVLLMNLKKQREEINKDDIFQYIRQNNKLMVLPDQDVLNGLFGNKIFSMDDSIFNYDVRKSSTYLLSSNGEKDTNWVINNTVILHFCGKQKPWKSKYTNKFTLLYKHYYNLSKLHSNFNLK